MGGGLGLLPLKSRHAERCFGLLVYYAGQPVLGWSVSRLAGRWLLPRLLAYLLPTASQVPRMRLPGADGYAKYQIEHGRQQASACAWECCI